MKDRSSFVLWAPRVLGIGFALFISIFALDAFEGMVGFRQKATALFMHLIPTWLCLLGIWLAWRREWVGVVLFLALAAVHLVGFWGRFPWTAYALIDGPLVVLAVLYGLAWRARRGAMA